MDIKKLRQKILDLAISGKLVPQDPNDEPASVLLERIRAEKERLIAEGKIKRPKKSKSSSAESHYQNFEPPFPIPNSWEWVRLEELCCRFSTGPFGSALHKHDYCTEGTPLINPTNIKEGRISISAIKRVCPDKVSELFRYILNENDIILARRGDLSKCAVISEEQAGWICGTGSFYLHLISISPRFFQIVYSSNYCQDYLKSESIGGTMDNLNQSLLSEFLIPIPPLSEQLRICCQVDDINCHIEDIEYSGFICMKTIESVKSHILDLAMQGKLVPQDPADEPAADMLRSVNPKAKIITDNPHSWNIPSSWTWCYLGDIFQHNTGKALNSSNKDGIDYEYITTSNVYWGRFVLGDLNKMPFKENEIEKCTVCKGDLLVCEGGDVGRAAIWNLERNIMIQNHLHRLRPLTNEICTTLYFHVFRLYKDRDLIGGKGIALQGFSTKSLHHLIVPLPPSNEQKRIAIQIEELYSILDVIEASLQS